MAGILVLPLAPALLPLLAALLLAGAAALGYLVGQTFERSPWPLFLIAQGVANVFVGTIRLVVTWASDGVINAATTMAAVFLNPAIAILHTTWAVGDTAAALWGLRTAIVPYIVALYTQGVWARLMQEVGDRTNAVNALFWTAYAWVQGLYSFTVGQIAQVTAYAQLLQRQAIEYARQGDAANARAIDDTGRRLVEFVQQLNAATIAWASGAITAEEQYTQRVAQFLQQELLQGFSVDQAYARALAQANAAAAGAGIAAVGAYAQSVAQTIMDQPCMRYCSPLGGIGQWVQELEEAGLVAGLIALAASSVNDPHGTALGLIDTFGGPLRDVGRQMASDAGIPLGAA